MKKIVFILLIFLIVGCTKTQTNPKTNKEEAIDIATEFISALSNGDVNKAVSFVDDDVEDGFISMGIEDITDYFKELDYPQEAIDLYLDYYNDFRDKLYKKISNFKVNDVRTDDNGYYEISGTIDTVNITDFDQYIFEDDLDDNTIKEIDTVYQNNGFDKALILYMQKIIENMKPKLDSKLAETKSETVPIYISLEETDSGLKITGVDSLFIDSYSYSESAEDYDSHGISTKLDENWYELNYTQSKGSTYAVANDNFNNVTYCELHFSEQLAMGSQADYDDYVKNNMPDIVRENFSSYDTCDVEIVTVSIDNKDFYAVHIDASAGNNHLYELDIPIHTNDNNLTMIAILSYYEDLTHDVLKLVHIE